MYPITAVLIGLIILAGGSVVWITMLLRAFLDRKALSVGEGDPQQFAEAAEDHRRLEVRLGQLEDEVEFLRKLKEPEPVARLGPPEDVGTNDR